MLTRAMFYVLDKLPWLRGVIWPFVYDNLAKRNRQDTWTFMNYGLVLSDDARPDLKPEDEVDRLCIQLYHRVASAIDLTGKQVLEVGSGRGGGASFVARYHAPRSVVGVDRSPHAVEFCQKRHESVSNLSFKVGDAEALPFDDHTFDVLINIESSHCYKQLAAFFGEVVRVLRPGGWFLYADLRPSSEMETLKASLAAEHRLTVINYSDITTEVADAFEADHERRQSFIRANFSPQLQHLWSELIGLRGSQMHTNLQQGKISYMFAVAKTTS